MSESVIQVRNLRKRIGNKDIVKNINFDIHKGEVLGFLGPNGSGKTTTMRMMLGLMSITEGDVTISGHNIKTDKEEALKHVGGIVENPEMYKFLSGHDNLKHFWRMSRGVPIERIDELAELVDLKDAMKNKVKTYSLGMRQRLGVAQALLHSPDVLILDEPTNGLDPAGIRELRDHLRKLAKEENLAIFISSHLLSEIELICDRVVIIQKGEITNVQNVEETAEEDTIVFAIEVDDNAKALAMIKENPADIPVVEEDGKVMVETSRESIPAINAALVRRDIKVYGIQQVRKSLEDRFLELTGGNKAK